MNEQQRIIELEYALNLIKSLMKRKYKPDDVIQICNKYLSGGKPWDSLN